MNGRSNYGVTQILVGNYRGRRKIVEYLIKGGGDVNARDTDGLNGIILASANGRFIVGCQIYN